MTLVAEKISPETRSRMMSGIKGKTRDQKLPSAHPCIGMASVSDCMEVGFLAGLT